MCIVFFSPPLPLYMIWIDSFFPFSFFLLPSSWFTSLPACVYVYVYVYVYVCVCVCVSAFPVLPLFSCMLFALISLHVAHVLSSVFLSFPFVPFCILALQMLSIYLSTFHTLCPPLPNFLYSNLPPTFNTSSYQSPCRLPRTPYLHLTLPYPILSTSIPHHPLQTTARCCIRYNVWVTRLRINHRGTARRHTRYGK